MAVIKYTLILLHCFVLVVAAETALSFFVSKKSIATLNKTYGQQAVRRLDSLLEMMEKTLASPEANILGTVNQFFNQLEYSPDMVTWKKKDYWASRLEFLGQGRGDCEDYAVAKFLTMMQLGVPAQKLFLTYVKAVGYPDAAHMVVTYFQKPGSVPLVLDNYNKKILPATQRRDLIPVYSFTANDLYLQKQKGLGKRINRKTLKNQRNLQAIDLEIRKRVK
ncbi:MAG: transglutaminase [Desulfobacterales bacterium]|nr:transglutaminase [Desulfobacterales bacterium]